MALGRAFVEGEEDLGRDHVVVLSHTLWASRFAADPAIIGRSIILDGEPYTVAGVLEKGNPFERGGLQIWRPLSFPAANRTRDYHWLLAYGLLGENVTLQQARLQMNALAISLAHDYPETNKGYGIRLEAYKSIFVGDETAQSLYVLMGAVGLVLLIACANLANLTLIRGTARERELAIRTTLGAGRWNLVRLLLSESALLSMGGGLIGLAFAYAGIVGMKAIFPSGWLPRESVIRLNQHVLLFALVLTIVTGVASGLVPAIRASRSAPLNSLKEGGIGVSVGRNRHVLRSFLVVTEVALASILLVGAGLLIRTFLNLKKVELGFDPTNVITAHLPIGEKRYATGDELRFYLHQIMERVGSLPGVRDEAVTSALPLDGWNWTMGFQVAGSKAVNPAERPSCYVKMVSPSYFRTLGMQVVGGRLLNNLDVKGAPLSVVINETMAKNIFPNEDPIGKQLLIDEILYGKTHLGAPIPWQVVGVVADEKLQGLSEPHNDHLVIYVTLDQCPQSGEEALIVRANLAPSVMWPSIAKAVREISSNQTLEGMTTLEETKTNTLGYERIRISVLSIFATTALLLSAIGLYGVISSSVAQRTREIGIRTALGASPRNILFLVLRNGVALTGSGLLIGLFGAMIATRLISAMLFDVERYDFVTLCSVASLLAIVSIAACIIPAVRAVSVDPAIALRSE
jgi:putative ABC transport system permease protein